MSITHASRLDDQQLTTELGRLAGCEREFTAALVAHLAEFDARRLYEGEGFPSIFKYCTTVLKLSEDSAYSRIQAARAACRFPTIVDRLTTGGLSVTTVRLLAPHLTPENHTRLLAAADGKGKHDVEHLLATWFPQPDVSPSVRRLPARTAGASVPPPATIGSEPLAISISPIACVAPAADPPVPAADPPAPSADSPAPAAAPTATRSAIPPRPVVRPLAAERYEIRFTASTETLEKLRTAQDLLGHAVPSGDLAQVFDRALTLLVADLARRKFAATPRPRASTKAGADEHIPAAVRRAVAVHDRAQCAFVSPAGRRCGERRFLEFHHIVPRAAGGRATVDNIQLRCRAHNGYAVDQYFGRGKRRTRDDGRRERAASAEGTRSGTRPVVPRAGAVIPTGG
jgi:hypothetical protein